MAFLRYEDGELASARELFDAVCAEARSMGYGQLAAAAGANLLHVCAVMGDTRAGRERGEDLVRELSRPLWRRWVLVQLSELALQAGDADAAARYLDRADGEEAAPYGTPDDEADVFRAAVEILRGDLDRAGELLTATLARGGSVRSLPRAMAHRWLAEVQLSRGDPAAAETAAQMGLDRAAALADMEVPLRRLLGLAQERQRPGTGREALERALALARAMGMRLEEGRALVALARAGLAADPEGDLRTAYALFDSCGAVGDMADIRAPSADGRP
jgi:hypothetical protein